MLSDHPRETDVDTRSGEASPIDAPPPSVVPFSSIFQDEDTSSIDDAPLFMARLSTIVLPRVYFRDEDASSIDDAPLSVARLGTIVRPGAASKTKRLPPSTTHRLPWRASAPSSRQALRRRRRRLLHRRRADPRPRRRRLLHRRRADPRPARAPRSGRRRVPRRALPPCPRHRRFPTALTMPPPHASCAEDAPRSMTRLSTIRPRAPWKTSTPTRDRAGGARQRAGPVRRQSGHPPRRGAPGPRLPGPRSRATRDPAGRRLRRGRRGVLVDDRAEALRSDPDAARRHVAESRSWCAAGVPRPLPLLLRRERLRRRHRLHRRRGRRAVRGRLAHRRRSSSLGRGAAPGAAPEDVPASANLDESTGKSNGDAPRRRGDGLLGGRRRAGRRAARAQARRGRRRERALRPEAGGEAGLEDPRGSSKPRWRYVAITCAPAPTWRDALLSLSGHVPLLRLLPVPALPRLHGRARRRSLARALAGRSAPTARPGTADDPAGRLNVAQRAIAACNLGMPASRWDLEDRSRAQCRRRLVGRPLRSIRWASGRCTSARAPSRPCSRSRRLMRTWVPPGTQPGRRPRGTPTAVDRPALGPGHARPPASRPMKMSENGQRGRGAGVTTGARCSIPRSATAPCEPRRALRRPLLHRRRRPPASTAGRAARRASRAARTCASTPARRRPRSARASAPACAAGPSRAGHAGVARHARRRWRARCGSSTRAALDDGAASRRSPRGSAWARATCGGCSSSTLGASPLAVAQHAPRSTSRAQLLDETALPMTEVAFARRVRAACGASTPRCATPSARRRASCAARARDAAATRRRGSTLRLPYRPPLDWDALLAFLGGRAIPGVERVDDGGYRRTFALDGERGVLEVRRVAGRARLALRARASPRAARSAARRRAACAALFDLDADPRADRARTSARPAARAPRRRAPGLRVPGAWDGFEIGGARHPRPAGDGARRDARSPAGWSRASARRSPAPSRRLTHLFPTPARARRRRRSRPIGAARARAPRDPRARARGRDGRARPRRAPRPRRARRARSRRCPGIGAVDRAVRRHARARASPTRSRPATSALRQALARPARSPRARRGARRGAGARGAPTPPCTSGTERIHHEPRIWNPESPIGLSTSCSTTARSPGSAGATTRSRRRRRAAPLRPRRRPSTPPRSKTNLNEGSTHSDHRSSCAGSAAGEAPQ